MILAKRLYYYLFSICIRKQNIPFTHLLYMLKESSSMVYYAASSEQCLLKVNEVRFQGQLIVIQGLFFLFFDLHHKECQLINRTLMMNLFSPRFKVCGFSMLTQITN